MRILIELMNNFKSLLVNLVKDEIRIMDIYYSQSV